MKELLEENKTLMQIVNNALPDGYPNL